MSQIDVSFLIVPGLFWWVALALALLVGMWGYYRLAAPLGKPTRTILRGARILAFLILLLALLEPLLTTRSEGTGRPRLAFLVDRSSSMQLPGSQGRTRHDEAADVLTALESGLGNSFDLDVLGFASRVEARFDEGPAYPWVPLGVTAVGDALEEILVRQGQAPVGGVVLITDGVHTSGKDPALVARNLPVPVFAVVLGDTNPPLDLLIRQVRTQPVGYVGEPVAVRALLEARGLEGQAAHLEVRERILQGGELRTTGQVLADHSLVLPQESGQETEVRLEISPTRIGLSVFEIVATTEAAEPVLVNNTRLFAIEVREKKTRLLYIECEPDWDFAFLKRTLDADTSLAYTYLVRQRDGEMIGYGSGAPDRVPQTAEELSPYAAVILGGALPELLPAGTVEALRQFVVQGGGLLFLGAGQGGDLERWRRALGDVMPLSVRTEPAWGYTATTTGVTLRGLSHEMTATDASPTQTERSWNKLPPVLIPEGTYRTAPGAAVLLEAKTAHPQRDVPLLALASAGGGRLAVLAGRGFWRWDFVMQSVSDDPPFVREFWRRMMRWLSEPLVRERFQVNPARHVFQDSEPLAFEARVYDESFRAIPSARVVMTVSRVADAAIPPQPIELILYPDSPPGRYVGTAAAMPPGMYRFRAEATARMRAGEVWTTEGHFWVEPMGPEFFELASSEALPRLLATSSGGLTVRPQELEQLVAAAPERYKRVQVVRQAEMWNHWAPFGVLILLLSIEWVVRRRKGLA
jgi:hypothetical protein